MHEISCTTEYMESFTNASSISHALNPFQYNEEYLELKDQLKKEFWKLVEEVCTERQKVIVRFYADGYTQTEMAKLLGVNQSSITKSLHGNVDYSNGHKVYGGAVKKLQRFAEDNQKIQEILNKMSELRDEKW